MLYPLLPQPDVVPITMEYVCYFPARPVPPAYVPVVTPVEATAASTFVTALVATAAVVASVALVIKIGAFFHIDSCARIDHNYLQGNRVAKGFLIGTGLVLVAASLVTMAPVAGPAQFVLGVATIVAYSGNEKRPSVRYLE